MARCIIFSRVSTDRQEVEQQSEILRQEAVKRGYSIDNQIVIEQHESGVSLTAEERKGVRMLEETIISNPDIDCVFIWEISRLSRRADTMYHIRDFLVSHKVQLISMNPAFELIDRDGGISQAASLILAIFTSFAENEAKLLRERSKRGMSQLKKAGKYTGGRVLYGYKVNEDGYFEIDDEAAKVIRRIYDLSTRTRMSGYSIAKDLYDEGVFPNITNLHNATATVNKILANHKYVGGDGYPSIVTQEQYDSATRLATARMTSPKTSSKNVYLLRGILVSGDTGYALSPSQRRKEYTFCRAGYPTCSLRMDYMDKWVWDYVCKNDIQVIDRQKLKANIIKKRNTLCEQLVRLDTKQKKLVSLYIDEKIPQKMYEDKEEEISAERNTIQCKIQELNLNYYTLSDESDRKGDCLTAMDRHHRIKNFIRDIVVTTTSYRRHHIVVHLMSGKVEEFDLGF